MRGRGWLIAAVVAVVAAVVGTVWVLSNPRDEAADLPLPTPTPLDERLYVDPAAQVVAVAATDARFAELAAVPQAKWFTGWSTVASATDDVARYVDGAAAAGEVPVLVLYQIPARDCGSYAGGGLADAAEYDAWIDAVAAGLEGHPGAIVLVEPDALPMLDACEGQGERIGMLRHAVDALGAAGASVYLDAGHSDWIDVDVMADRLVEAGVADARGFSLNVANFNATDDETRWGEALRAALQERGVDDAHYVIDTGRNGVDVAGDEACNPREARLGSPPQLFTGSALDAYLWVKPPGETDGTCRGGPDRGFWDELALELMGR